MVALADSAPATGQTGLGGRDGHKGKSHRCAKNSCGKDIRDMTSRSS